MKKRNEIFWPCQIYYVENIEPILKTIKDFVFKAYFFAAPRKYWMIFVLTPLRIIKRPKEKHGTQNERDKKVLFETKRFPPFTMFK